MIGKLAFMISVLAVMSVGGGGLSAVATAARPRATVEIASNSVKLSDLFSDLEAGQDCDIGPAPAPGKRIVIGQAQLAAIAEQFGIEWQPNGTRAEVMLERMARPIRREELLPPLRAALIAEGASESNDIALDSATPLLVPAETSSHPEIEALTYDRGSGRFSAEIRFESPGHDAIRLHVSGVAQEMIDAAVLARTMNAGSVLAPGDIEITRLRKSLVPERGLATAQDAMGLALRHRMVAGSPVSLDQLARPLMVTRGMPVLLRLEDTGLVLTAKGEAIEGGAMDERIHILNTDSRAILVARVTGPGQVQIDPASAPVLLSPKQNGLPSASSLITMPQFSDQ